MKKLVYFVALSLGLLLLLSCVQTLKDSLEVMTMDPAERKAYISLSDEEKDKYLQMNQEQRDQFRVYHDPEIVALQKEQDFAQQKVEIARKELDKAESDLKRRDVSYGQKILRMCQDRYDKWHQEFVRLGSKIERLVDGKLKSYAEARAAWEAKNKQMSGPVSGGCFTPDTLVLMESGYKRIADIKAGDRVLSVDSKGNRAVNEVVRHYILTNNHYYIINGKIKVTARHLFYTSGGDKRVQDLQTGDRIRMSDGTFEAIVSKERIAGDLTVYNLDVAENDNFFVSSDGSRGYLVHNCGAK